MKVGYARVSKNDGSQLLDMQIDALEKVGVKQGPGLYCEKMSGANDKRPVLRECLDFLRKGDTLYVWKLDRLGRSLKHLVNIAHDLMERGVGLKVLTGQGANIDTTTPSGKLVFGIFAALAEFERELIRERTMAGLKAARARGRRGGRKPGLTKSQVRLAQAAMRNRDTVTTDLCRELKVSKATLYRYVSPEGDLRKAGEKVLNGDKKGVVI